MQIQCPHCEKDNNINLDANVVCGACKKNLAGFSYQRIKKPMVSAVTALFIGVFGYKAVDKYVLEDRYPLKTEYAILDACINSDSSVVSSTVYKGKKTVCLCALDKTMSDVSYEDFKDDQYAFGREFKKVARECL